MGDDTQTFATRTSVYRVVEPGIIEQRVNEGALQTVADAEANCAAFLRMAGEPGACCLVDMRTAGPAEPGVNDVYASERLAERVHALALLTESAVSHMVGNFFLAIKQPPMPTRMFRSREQALGWLRSQRPAAARVG